MISEYLVSSVKIVSTFQIKLRKAIYVRIYKLRIYMAIYYLRTFFWVSCIGREAKENNYYFLCVQEPNNVALLDDRRPVGLSAPHGH